MNIVLEVKSDKQPSENDVIVFKGGCWRAMPKDSLFAKAIKEQREANAKMETEISKIKKDLVALAMIVKEK